MRIQRGEFCKNWNFQYVNFWIKCGFLPQCAQVTTQWDDLESKEETHFLLLKSSFKVEKEALEKMVN